MNTFKERLKAFSPLKSLTGERAIYFSKRQKFVNKVLIGLAVILSLIPLLFMILCLDFEVVKNEVVSTFFE